MRIGVLLFVFTFLFFFISCENGTNNNKNKNLILQDKEFVKANNEQMLAIFFDATEIMNMSENEQVNKLKELYPTTTIYIKGDNIEENIIINKTESVPLNKLSAYYENNYEEMEEIYLSNTGYSSEILENKIIKIDDKYECLTFRTKFNGPELNRYSSNYHLEINNQFFHIVTNTYNDEPFGNLISIR